jgi:hypothetical protein
MSARFDELFMINRYTHLMHLVSNIKGILKFNGNAIDIIQAIVPSEIPGSCPTLRCMEVNRSITNDFESNVFETQVLSPLFRNTPRVTHILHLRQKPGLVRMMTLEKLNFSFKNPVF